MSRKVVSGQDTDTVYFMDHKSKNTHLCGTSIVQLNSTLPHLPLISLIVPSEVKSSITVVTGELWGNIRPLSRAVDDLSKSEEEGHLQ